jgi:hypothetical protein
MQIVYSVVVYFTKNLKANCAYNLHTWVQILVPMVTWLILRFISPAPRHVGQIFAKQVAPAPNDNLSVGLRQEEIV